MSSHEMEKPDQSDLFQACLNGNLATVQACFQLSSKPADIDTFFGPFLPPTDYENQTCQLSYTPLGIAAARNHPSVVAFLLDQKVQSMREKTTAEYHPEDRSNRESSRKKHPEAKLHHPNGEIDSFSAQQCAAFHHSREVLTLFTSQTLIASSYSEILKQLPTILETLPKSRSPVQLSSSKSQEPEPSNQSQPKKPPVSSGTTEQPPPPNDAQPCCLLL